MKSEKLFFLNSRKQKLAGMLYLPDTKPKAIAIFCHGYRSTKEARKVSLLLSSLVKEGIGFFAFDFSGMGESDGKFQDTTVTDYIDDLDSCIDFIFKYSNKIFVIGSSLGGLVSLRQSIDDKRIKALALIAPVSVFPWSEKKEYSAKGISDWKKKGYTYTYSKRFGKMKINYSFYDDLSKFKDCSVYKNIKFPCLIVHGDKDTSIPLAHSINLSNNINGSRLKIIKNAGHKFSTHENSKKLKNEVVSFLIGLIK